MKEPNFAPMYAAMYPMLSELTRKHGYALAVHGSVARDFDLVCIPWVECPSNPKTVVRAMVNEFAIKEVSEPEIKEHGRKVFTLSIGFGECFLDLSFMPITQK